MIKLDCVSHPAIVFIVPHCQGIVAPVIEGSKWFNKLKNMRHFFAI